MFYLHLRCRFVLKYFSLNRSFQNIAFGSIQLILTEEVWKCADPNWERWDEDWKCFQSIHKLSFTATEKFSLCDEVALNLLTQYNEFVRKEGKTYFILMEAKEKSFFFGVTDSLPSHFLREHIEWKKTQHKQFFFRSLKQRKRKASRRKHFVLGEWRRNKVLRLLFVRKFFLACAMSFCFVVRRYQLICYRNWSGEGERLRKINTTAVKQMKSFCCLNKVWLCIFIVLFILRFRKLFMGGGTTYDVIRIVNESVESLVV